MEKTTNEKSNFCRRINVRASAAGMALLSLFLLCFVPDRPFSLATNFPADQLNEKRAEQIHETFRIYGVIKSNAPHFDDDFAWRLAAVVRVESQRRTLDPLLVLAVIKTESSFDDKAVSVKGARGLMQIRPLWAKL
jgi:soluble lytic murein transglycosylase-like protein